MEKKKGKMAVPILIIMLVLIVFFPLFLFQGTVFSGSDEAGSEMVEEITGGVYEPWFTPIMERVTGGEIPRETETLFFCIQTGIGVGIIAFCFGWLAARRKYNNDPEDKGNNTEEKVT